MAGLRVLVLGVALLAGCRCGDEAPLQLEGPSRLTVDPPVPPPAASRLEVPLVVTSELLASVVNEVVPPRLLRVKDFSLGPGFVADVTIKRAGDVRVWTDDVLLRVSMPLAVIVKPTTTRGVGGILGQTVAQVLGELSGEMSLNVGFNPSIGSGWSLAPRSVVTTKWTEQPGRIAGLGAFPAGLISEALVGPLKTVRDRIDEGVQRGAGIAERVTSALDDLALVRQVSAKPDTWLTFQPVTLYGSPLRVTPRGLRMDLAVDGPLSLVTGARPPMPEPAALSPYRKPPGGRVTEVHMPISLKWGVLKRQLRSLRGTRRTQSLPAGGELSATIVDVLDVYPTDRGIALGLHVRAEAVGQDLDVVLWFEGRPEIEGEGLRVSGFRYDATTDSPLANTVHAWVTDDLQAALVDLLYIPLKEPLDQAREALSGHLGAGETVDGVKVSGEVRSLELADVHVTKQALIPVVSATLKAKVKLTEGLTTRGATP